MILKVFSYLKNCKSLWILPPSGLTILQKEKSSCSSTIHMTIPTFIHSTWLPFLFFCCLHHLMKRAQFTFLWKVLKYFYKGTSVFSECSTVVHEEKCHGITSPSWRTQSMPPWSSVCKYALNKSIYTQGTITLSHCHEPGKGYWKKITLNLHIL